MRYETLKKEGVIYHPDKGNLEIVTVDGFIETPTIPILSHYAGSISQTMISDRIDVTVSCSEKWLSVELLSGIDIDNLHSYTFNIDYQNNTTKKYRSASIVITINAQRHIIEVIQRP